MRCGTVYASLTCVVRLRVIVEELCRRESEERISTSTLLLLLRCSVLCRSLRMKERLQLASPRLLSRTTPSEERASEQSKAIQQQQP